MAALLVGGCVAESMAGGGSAARPRCRLVGHSFNSGRRLVLMNFGLGRHCLRRASACDASMWRMPGCSSVCGAGSADSSREELFDRCLGGSRFREFVDQRELGRRLAG